MGHLPPSFTFVGCFFVVDVARIAADFSHEVSDRMVYGVVYRSFFVPQTIYFRCGNGWINLRSPLELVNPSVVNRITALSEVRETVRDFIVEFPCEFRFLNGHKTGEPK